MTERRFISGARVSGRSWLANAGFAATLAGLAVLPWLPAARAPFLNFDDDWLVEQNPAIRSLTLASVRRMFDPSIDRIAYGAEYLPLRDVSYALDHAIWGPDPAGYRATQLVLYAATVLVLALWARTLGLSRAAAVTAAILFAWHPVHSESVAWISGRKDVLCGLLFFAGLLFHRISLTATPRRAWILETAAILAGPLATLSKAMAVVYPAALIAADWFHPTSQDRGANSSIASRELLIANLGARGGPRARRTLAVAAISAALILPILAIQLGVGRRFIVKAYEAPQSTVIATMAVVFLSYVRRLLLPIALAPLADVSYRPLGDPLSTAGAAFLALAALFVAWGAFRRGSLGPISRPVAFAGLWFLVVMAPFSNLVPFQHLLADRYLYLAVAGSSIALAQVLVRIPRRIAIPLGSTVLASFAALSTQRALVWSHPDRLYLDALAKDPENHFLHLLRGEYLARIGHEGAEPEFLQALARPPRSTPFDLSHAHLALGNFLSDPPARDRARALRHYELALAIDRSSPQAWAGVGNVHKATGRFEAALEPYLEASRLAPREPTYPVALAGCYFELERLDDARHEFERALELESRLFQAHLGLAEIDRRQGNRTAAHARLESALSLAPPDLARPDRERLEALSRALADSE